MQAAAGEQAYTTHIDPPFAERLMRSLEISASFWPEVANLSAFDPTGSPVELQAKNALRASAASSEAHT